MRLLYRRKRTCALHWTMSAMGHKRTLVALLDDFVGTGNERGR
jgi:hypothetical protein